MTQNKAYREAEKKIEEAQRTGSIKLDLSLMKLTDLPELLWELIQLQTLNLAGNQLTAVPESIGQLSQLQSLDLAGNQLTAVPDTIGQLTQLQSLNLNSNQLTAVPETIGRLTQLQSLNISENKLTELPDTISNLKRLTLLEAYENKFREVPNAIRDLKLLVNLQINANDIAEIPDWIGRLPELRELYLGAYYGGIPLKNVPAPLRPLTQVRTLGLADCQLASIPDWIGEFSLLERLLLFGNQLTDLPPSLSQLEHLQELVLDENPLNPELASAYKEGLVAVKAYLRAKAGAQIRLNEAKLILVGEGEVGKTCLMDALEGKEWQEHPTTHGIEIRTITAVDPASSTEISLNGWDFGGQRVYRPTHQLFFSSPAVYLVVWKPREGPQQGFVKEWIKLIKHREPDAKILVVATHGGPQQRQPDIDRQELKDLFGEETILNFFFVDSKPDENGQRHGITELKDAIARVAADLPEMGREVPESFQKTRETLAKTDATYLPLAEVHAICYEHGMEKQLAKLFVAISHRLGHLIHYAHDPALRDIVILKPDWLTTAISFVLDDKKTRQDHGLVSFERLSQLWHDPRKKQEERYEASLHRIFLRLMERFDLSYRVAGLSLDEDRNPISLIAQLVPDNRPEVSLQGQWAQHQLPGDSERVQICQIVDEQSGQSANAEGLFYQLIVRLHRYRWAAPITMTASTGSAAWCWIMNTMAGRC